MTSINYMASADGNGYHFTSEVQDSTFSRCPLAFNGASIYFKKDAPAQGILGELLYRQLELYKGCGMDVLYRDGTLVQRCKNGGKGLRVKPIIGAHTEKELRKSITRF